jgi:hypothetical protein
MAFTVLGEYGEFDILTRLKPGYFNESRPRRTGF